MKHKKTLNNNHLLAEGELVDLVESEASAPVWDTVLIKPGLSKNLTYYPETLLQQTAYMFEGARAFARSDEAHSYNTDVSIKNIAGIYKNVSYREGAIRGELHFLSDAIWLHDKLQEARKLGQKDLFGLSIVASGTSVIKKHKSQNVRWAESIDQVISCDPVVFPAAGGRLVKLAASENDFNQGDLEMFDRLYKFIETHYPEMVQGQENISEDDLFVIFQEALTKSKSNGVAAKIQADPEQLVVFNEAVAKINSQVTDTKTQLVETQKQLNRIQVENLLTQKLMGSKLHERTQQRIRNQFSTRDSFTEADLDQVIKEELEYLATFSETGKVNTDPVTAGMTSRDKVIKALDGFFFKTDLDKVPRFKSFREAYVMITGDKSLTGQLAEARNLGQFTESLDSTSWAQILGDSITRRMLAEYVLPELQAWRRITSDIIPIHDFRTQRRMRMGGYGVLPGVNEQANYTDLTSPTDNEVTYAISKKGGLESVTMEMIANDDVGAVQRIPLRLGRAAAWTLYKTLFDIFTSNSGQGIPLAMNDDTDYLFKSTNSHGNYGTDALSATGLNTARAKMRSQTAYNDNYEFLGITPKFLLVPNELEELAFKLCMGPFTLISSGTTEVSDQPNIYNKEGLQYEVIDYWTDPTNWYLVADPHKVPTIEVGFFQGREEPELFIQDQPNIGSMFTADKITYKIRHIWGYTVLDYRGFFGSVVTG